MLTFRQPFENEWPITQKYGENTTSSFHTGIDYGCPEGTRILASNDGVVKFADLDKTGYGKCVIIQHNAEKSTLYAHLSMILVYPGEKVKKGECIGLSGNTGKSTGPHLHFEAREQWNQFRSHFDPMDLPLTSVVDYKGILFPSKSENKLTSADALKKGKVEICAPAGAYLHNTDFSSKTAYPYGTNLYYTGNKTNHNGYEFCECELTVWVAAYDSETQILKNI